MRARQILVGLALASSTALWAATPSLSTEGLGTAQPNVQNVSKSPSWRVYRYQKDGIEYLQVNDIGGQVRFGIGAANGVVLVLPMGLDADQVSTPAAPLNVAVTGGQVVYQDAQATISEGVSSTGQTIWTVTSNASRATTQTTTTNGGSTCDPNDCGINRVNAQAATTTNGGSTCDPNDCGINRVTAQAATTTTNGGSTCDPNDCGINRVTVQAATTTTNGGSTCDPNDCGINRVTVQAATTTTTNGGSTCDPNDCGINRVTSQ